MNNIPSRAMILDLSTLVLLDNTSPQKLLQLYESSGSQDITAAAGQSAARQPEVFAQHQVRVANPYVGSSSHLSHYGPAINGVQMNAWLNTVQEPSMMRRSPQPVDPDLHSFNQQESQGNSLCCAINHNDSERRVTSYPPEYPTEASPADPFAIAMRNYIRRTQNKATKQLPETANRTIVTTALRKKILFRKSGKSAGITADPVNIPVSESMVKIVGGTAPLRNRVSTRSSVKSNRAK